VLSEAEAGNLHTANLGIASQPATLRSRLRLAMTGWLSRYTCAWKDKGQTANFILFIRHTALP